MSDTLASKGWGVFENLVDADVVAGLRTEALELWEAERFRAAQVGATASRDKRPEIRSDHIHWLEEATATHRQARWLEWVEGLRLALNRDLFLGANVYEGHLAMYPAGSFYKPHLDQHAGSDRRRLTVILYLNPDWKKGDGGELRLCTEPGRVLDENAPFVNIEPRAGRVVAFVSGGFWHEVLTAVRPRMALTGWLQRD